MIIAESEKVHNLIMVIIWSPCTGIKLLGNDAKKVEMRWKMILANPMGRTGTIRS